MFDCQTSPECAGHHLRVSTLWDLKITQETHLPQKPDNREPSSRQTPHYLFTWSSKSSPSVSSGVDADVTITMSVKGLGDRGGAAGGARQHLAKIPGVIPDLTVKRIRMFASRQMKWNISVQL